MRIYPITLLRSITFFCGTNYIPQNIFHIQPDTWEYYVEYCQPHKTLLQILIMVCPCIGWYNHKFTLVPCDQGQLRFCDVDHLFFPSLKLFWHGEGHYLMLIGKSSVLWGRTHHCKLEVSTYIAQQQSKTNEGSHDGRSGCDPPSTHEMGG